MSDDTRRREYDSQRRFFGGGGGGTSKPNASSSGDPFADDDDDEIPNTAGAGGADPNQSAYSWAWNFFTKQAGGGAGTGQSGGPQGPTRQETESQQFGDVFEEMLREEGMADQNGQANNRFWGMLGGASGGALGFIVANVPGLLAGAVAGNRLGAIRDAKGKSVYSVFQVTTPPLFSSTVLFLDEFLLYTKLPCSLTGTSSRRSRKAPQPVGCQGIQPCCRCLTNCTRKQSATLDRRRTISDLNSTAFGKGARHGAGAPGKDT